MIFNKNQCRILIYHSIENCNRNEDKLGLAVSPDVFYMHMMYLKENKFNVIGLLDLVKIIQKSKIIPKKSIVITFDDGYKSILTNALPILKEFGLSSVCFVNIYFIEKKVPKHLYWTHWPTLNWEDIKTLSEDVQIGSHGLTHRKLTSLNHEDLLNEIGRSKELLEAKLKEEVNAFSYPHGAFNSKVKKVLRECGYFCSCSSVEGTNNSFSDLFFLRRTEISAYDNSLHNFEKKILGCYDWLGKIHKWKSIA